MLMYVVYYREQEGGDKTILTEKRLLRAAIPRQCKQGYNSSSNIQWCSYIMAGFRVNLRHCRKCLTLIK